MWVIYYFPSGRLPLNYINSFTILEYVMLWFFIAGNITAIHRGVQSWYELKDQELPFHKKRAQEFYNKLSKPRNSSGPQKMPNELVKRTRLEKPLKPIKIQTRKNQNKKPISNKSDNSKREGFEIEWESKPKAMSTVDKSRIRNRKIKSQKYTGRPKKRLKKLKKM